MHIVDAVLLGISLVVFLAAGIVAGYGLHKGYGPVSALIRFFLTIALGGVGTFLLFMLYASLYYAGGGH